MGVGVATTGRASAFLALASATSRASLLLVALAAAGEGRELFSLTVYILGAAAALQVLLDPNAATLIAARWPSFGERLRRGIWFQALALQALAALAAAAATLLLAVAVSPRPEAVLLGGALGLLAASESLVRYGRVPWQVAGRFALYGGTDLAIALGRALTALSLWLAGTTALASTSLACAAALLLLLPVQARAIPRRASERMPWRSLLSQLWPYGAGTFVSSLYSAGPLVVIGFLGGVGTAGTYSLIARITQSSELIPAAIAAAYLPRLSQSGGGFDVLREQLRAAFLGSLGAIGGLLIVGPFLLSLFPLARGEALFTLLLLSLALAPKFLSFQLVALAAVLGRMRTRLQVSCWVAGFVLLGSLLAAPRGASELALVVLLGELGLFLLLANALRKSIPQAIERPLELWRRA